MISRLWLCLTILLFMWVGSSSFAAVVKAVKDNQIILDMEGDNFKVGDVLKIWDGSGKQVGLAKIKAVKGNKAKAVIKGRAEAGFKLTLRSGSGGDSGGGSRHATGPSDHYWGVVVGFDSASATATLAADNDSVKMSGSGFLLQALYDKTFFPWLGFRGLAGITSFDVSGPTDSGCNGGGTCNTSIVYFGGDFLGRVLIKSFWVGAGVDLLFPLSKSATAIAPSSISNTLLYDLALGYDWRFASGNYIPIQFDYQLFPSSSTVSAHMISISAGYAFKW